MLVSLEGNLADWFLRKTLLKSIWRMSMKEEHICKYGHRYGFSLKTTPRISCFIKVNHLLANMLPPKKEANFYWLQLIFWVICGFEPQCLGKSCRLSQPWHPHQSWHSPGSKFTQRWRFFTRKERTGQSEFIGLLPFISQQIVGCQPIASHILWL